MSDDFGTLLAALRTSKVVTVVREKGSKRWTVTCALSQNELAYRAGVDPAYINRIEKGRYGHASRAIVEKLADALELGPHARARLLVAAGHWPWPEVDGDDLDLLLSAALAIAEGDYRMLSESPPARLETAARLEAR